LKHNLLSKILFFSSIVALTYLISSCENVGVIDENEMTPLLNDVINVIFNSNNDQNWSDTTINYNDYVTVDFDSKKASICKLINNNNLISGTILKISLYNQKNNAKRGKEIIIFKNLRGESELQLDGKFTKPMSGSDEENQKYLIDGSIVVKSQKNETIYLHNLKQWTDGGITGMIEIKGKGKLLFERTGNTIFFDKRTIIY
jgi:hypothetical protein